MNVIVVDLFALTKPLPKGEAFKSPSLWEGFREGKMEATLII